MEGNIYSVFVTPDGQRVQVQPITLAITRKQPTDYGKTETGAFPWGQISEEIFPGGFSEIDTGGIPTESSKKGSINWKKVVAKMLHGYSYKQHYIENISRNPYLTRL